MSGDNSAFRNPSSKGKEPGRSTIKRPLLPLVVALMAGLTAAAWGLEIPPPWLLGLSVGLLVVLALLLFRSPSSRPDENH